MWELDYKESWVPKNWCFSTVVLEDLRVPSTARRSNQFILKEISPEYSLEGLMLKLRRQYFGVWWDATWCKELTHLKRPWWWERLKAGEGDNRGWGGWMAAPTQSTWVWVNSGSLWWLGRPGVWQKWGCNNSDMTEQLNWLTLEFNIDIKTYYL